MRLQMQEYRRCMLVPVFAVALAVYYVLFYVPLGKKVEGLDAPLQKNWRNLAGSLGQSNATTIDFAHITNQLTQTRHALGLLQSARQRTADRVELSPEVKARMDAPFQLVEYDNERSKFLDTLSRAAKQQKVTVESSVYYGFPEHTADVRQPDLLWAALAMLDGLLHTALQSKVTVLHRLEVPLALTNAPATNPSLTLHEIPVQLEFTGSVSNVANLLQALPLRGDELKAAGLPDANTNKPPLFLERLILKKQSPDKPDELRVWLRAVGFVLRK